MKIVINLEVPDVFDIAKILMGFTPFIFLLALLAGCSLFESKVEYKPFEVKVPIPVPCAAQIPPAPTSSIERLARADTLDDKVKAMLEDRAKDKGYIDQLKAATDGCR